MTYYKKHKVFFKAGMFLLSFLLLAGTLLLCQISSVIAKDNSKPSAAPINPDFAKYLKDIQTGKINPTDAKYKLGLTPLPFNFSYLNGKKVFPSKALPAAYDLRTLGKVTSVKDQGSAGSCWSFATYASLESYLLPGATWDFSENNLKNTHGFDWHPNTGGGNFQMSTAYLARWSGPKKESDDPYNPNTTTSPSGLTTQKHVQEVLWLPGRANSTDNATLKQAVMTYGAVYTSLCYDFGTSYFNDTYDAYYYNGSSNANHAVAIVGWNDNFDKSKFKTTPPGNGAFICKNSWGTTYGEQGYFYVSYYDTKLGMYSNAVFENAEAVTNYKANYQYDPLGMTDSYGWEGQNYAWMANVFTATSSDKLAAVGFYAVAPNTAYQISVYTNAANGPTSGTLAGSKTGTIPVPGYHTIPLTSAIQLTSGQKFSVVIKVTTPNYNFPLPAEERRVGYTSGATASAGQSYASPDGTAFSDWTTWFPNDNLCIKAYTANATAGYTVSGKTTIMSSTGTALPGVTITFTKVSGTGTTVPGAVTTNSSGAWSQTGFAAGTTYRATPTKTGYTFSPTYSDFSAASTSKNFIGLPKLLTVGAIEKGSLAAGDINSQYRGTGYYADKFRFSGTAGAQIAVSLSSKDFDPYLYLTGPNGSLVARDDSSGEEWDSLIPAKGFYTLPSTGTYTIEATSYASGKTGSYTLNISAPTNYLDSGWVNTNGDSWISRDGSPLLGTLITFSRTSGTGNLPAAVTTDAAGKWAQTGFASGTTYKATPSKAGFVFAPSYVTFASLHSRTNFKASQASFFSGSGKVTQGSSTGAALAGVKMTFSRISGSGSIPPAVTTDTNGNWSQKGFAAGTTYRVTPTKTGYSFSPAYRDFSVASTTLNFFTTQATGKSWTFMLYGAADNNLDSYMTTNLNQIAAAGYDSDVNVVVFYDGFGSTAACYKVLESTGWVTKSNLGELNSGSPTTLTNFINWAKQNYPAQKYALDLWDHGGGFRDASTIKPRGIAWDDTNGDHLTMPELRTALENSGLTKIDMVGTDACLMAQLEVAHEIKDKSSYFVASEQTIPGAGWPYTPVINALDPGTTTALQLGTAIADNFVATYSSNACMSVADQTKMNALTTAVNNLANVLKTNVATYKTQINNARNASQAYEYADFVDLYDLTLKLDANCTGMSGLSTATAAVRTAIAGNAVVYNKYNSPLTGSHGLTIWMPARGMSGFTTTMTNDYKPLKFANDTQWDEFLTLFMS